MENEVVKPEVQIEIEDDMLCPCGEESTRGCHGVNVGDVHSEYYCDDCYNKKS